jgi:hypothetical protein
MAGDEWHDFAETVKVVRPERFLPPPTDDDLDDFQRRTGFRLPRGYRSFVTRFGPGSIGTYYPIDVPGRRGHGPHVDLDDFMRFRDKLIADGIFDFYDDPERARRLVFFCSTIDIERVGWDPQEVTDAEAPEYAVYLVNRSGGPVERIAGSFREFIMEYCLGDRLPKKSRPRREYHLTPALPGD